MPHDLEILSDTIDMWSFQFRCWSTITPKNFALVTLCIASGDFIVDLGTMARDHVTILRFA